MSTPNRDEFDELRERAAALADEHSLAMTAHRLPRYIKESQKCLRDLLAYAEGQRAVVERLPKTADGLRVVGGDSVYDPDTGMELDCVLDGRDWAYEPGPHHDGDQVRSISECYSTPEAAEAARKDTADR